MKKYDEYEKLVKTISEYAIENAIMPDTDYISKIYKNANQNIKNTINKAIKIRNEFGCIDEDVKGLHIVLDAGSQHFTNFENIDIAFCVSYDICCKVNRNNLIKECEKYNSNDEIFLAYPSLRACISEK